MSKLKRMVPSMSEYRDLILAAAAGGGTSGVPQRGLAKPGKAGREAFEQALEGLLAEGALVAIPAGKNFRYALASLLPTQTEIAARMLEVAEAALEKGASRRELVAKSGAPPLPDTDLALEGLLASGALLEGKKKYFSAQAVRAAFRVATLEKIKPGEVWSEAALLSRSPLGPEREELADMGVRGELTTVEFVDKGHRRTTAYGLSTGGGSISEVATPDWTALLKQARILATRRADHTVSFEDLATSLGVSTLVVKALIQEQLARGEPLQLIEGDPREIRDLSTAGLERAGLRFFRFRFLDEP